MTRPFIQVWFNFRGKTWVAEATTGERSKGVHLVYGFAVLEVCEALGVKRADVDVSVESVSDRAVCDALPECSGIFGV